MFYQPQVSSLDGSITGVEALLRWNHPEKGLLSPVFFMTVAEETGIIVELGQWILNKAISEVKEWLDSGLPLARNWRLKSLKAC